MTRAGLRVPVRTLHACPTATFLESRLNSLVVCQCGQRWVKRWLRWVRFRGWHIAARWRFGLTLRNVARPRRAATPDGGFANKL